MRRFFCECQNPLFFENTSCLTCGAFVEFDPVGRDLLSLEQAAPDVLTCKDSAEDSRWRFCANRDLCACNWLIPVADPSPLCQACATTRTIPNLSAPDNQENWRTIETSTRRILYTLLDLELWGASSRIQPSLPLVFDFLSELPGGPPVSSSSPTNSAAAWGSLTFTPSHKPHPCFKSSCLSSASSTVSHL